MAGQNQADLLNPESGSDVNALFRWSCLRPYHIDIVHVEGLQLIKTDAKFYCLSNDVKILRKLRKLCELMAFKDG